MWTKSKGAPTAPAQEDTGLLRRLISRGDTVSIEHGRLKIEPKSGICPSEQWMAANADQLLFEILLALGLDAYRYESYKTGKYGEHKAGGVTIQFRSLILWQPAYVVFNASLDRLRGPEKGKSLKGGQFRVGERSRFVRFWREAGLVFPNRLSKFHDYMGNLRGILFTGTLRDERLDKRTMTPMSVRYESIKQVISPDNNRTHAGQRPDKFRTILPDNDSVQSQAGQGTEPVRATWQSNYGKKVVRDTGKRDSTCNPQEQSVEDWWRDYENG